jgi:hypothetical protein
MDDPGNYYSVEINNRLTGVVRGRAGGKPVILARRLGAGPHHLRLTRRNLSFDRPTSFVSLMLERGGKAMPTPKRKQLKIEFIGDSYTVAEGNEAKEPAVAWTETLALTDSRRGFAGLLADACDADYRLVARSGSGVLCDWKGNREDAMLERYGWTLMEQSEPAWQPDDWTPDLVVICLGINDHAGLSRSGGGITKPEESEFRAAYRNLLARVRNHSPRAEILAVAHFHPWVRRQVSRIAREDGRLHYASFDEFPGGYVANGHPTLETHRRMANQLLPALARIPGVTLPAAGRARAFSAQETGPRRGAN